MMSSVVWNQRIRRFRIALCYWLDPQSRRPLIVLAALSMLLFLSPLIVDVVWALFFKFSPRIRWWLGELLFVGLLALGLRRLLTVRPGDTWPARDAPCYADPAGRWIPWVLRLAVVSLLVPILPRRGYLGFADWDFVLDKFEAVRQTIVYWGQFPWWNPWCRGGFPLAGEPQIGAMSIATPLLLSFGTTTGLAVAAVVCIGLAVEGAYRLGRLWLVDCCAAAAVALVYGLNGAVLVNTAWGYVLPMSYCSLPWIVYHTFRLGERWSSALWLGAWLSFAVLNGIQYLNLYAGVLAGMVWLRGMRLAAPAERRLLGLHTAAALGMWLAICGWRLGPVLKVLADDQREQISFWDESLLAVPHYLLQRPAVDWPAVIPAQHAATFAELSCYVGPVVVLLGLASLAHGWRWWHTLTLVTTALAIGSIRWYHPSYWVATWPLFESTHVVTRWRFVAVLGLGLSAGSVLERLRGSADTRLRVLAVGLVVLIGADYVELAHRQLPIAFSVRPEPELFPGPAVPDIVNVKMGLGYPATMRRYGVIQGYEPMLGGYRRDARTLRKAREDPDYWGEAWTADGPIKPAFWSPNRIVFQVRPGQVVHVNQNPGSWWWTNGRPAFPGLRCAELEEPFVASANDEGRLELRIHPRGLSLGLGLQFFGVGLLASSWWARRLTQIAGA